jgi:tRNA threonylcarbamoyladenosine biosynthesis protein TsaB
MSIETATGQVGCAIADSRGHGAAFSATGGRRHGETLAPMIEQVCRISGLALADVDAVAVDVGPGLFTGLRVGVATAKALGLSLGVPLVAVSSLEALAFPVRHWGPTIVAVVDARRGEVFWRAFLGGDTLKALGRPRVGPPGVLCAELAESNDRFLLVGDGSERYREMLAQVGRVGFGGEEHAFPGPAAVAELGRIRAAAGEVHSYRDVSPVYLREADVRIGWLERPALSGAVRAGDIGSGSNPGMAGDSGVAGERR